MGKAKTSRKGKKAWRKNIPTDDLEELTERSGREERSGANLLGSVADDSLFFVDKSGDGILQRKIDRHREKVLHCDSVLQRNSLVQPIPSSKKRKIKDTDVAKSLAKAVRPCDHGVRKKSKKECSFDLWEEAGASKSKWGKRFAHVKNTVLPNASAVEIDAPGCSYNPTYEDHQDALGAAVAQEMQQIYKKELEPEPIPLHVTGNAVDEEDMYFLEADQDDVEETPAENENEVVASRAAKNKKLTRTDINKRERKRALLKQEAEIKEKIRLEEELDRLPQIKESIQAKDEENERTRTRRMVSKKEREASCPPRLGKHKFKPDSIKVLLSEDVTGSLRKLKGCYMLLRERFKSLQRRGLVEPRVPVKKKVAKMWVHYEPGTKGAKEREAHAAMVAEREARKQALAVVPLAT